MDRLMRLGPPNIALNEWRARTAIANMAALELFARAPGGAAALELTVMRGDAMPGKPAPWAATWRIGPKRARLLVEAAPRIRAWLTEFGGSPRIVHACCVCGALRDPSPGVMETDLEARALGYSVSHGYCADCREWQHGAQAPDEFTWRGMVASRRTALRERLDARRT